MPEELKPDSLSDTNLFREGAPEAFAESERLLHRDVFDANGQRLGRINKCWMEEGRIVGCEVHLDHTLQRSLGVTSHTTEIKPKWMTEIGPDRIQINKAAAQVLGTTPPPLSGSEAAPEGSDTFPRKTR